MTKAPDDTPQNPALTPSPDRTAVIFPLTWSRTFNNQTNTKNRNRYKIKLTKHTFVDLNGGASAANHVATGCLDHVVSDDVTEDLLVLDDGVSGEVGVATVWHHKFLIVTLF